MSIARSASMGPATATQLVPEFVVRRRPSAPPMAETKVVAVKPAVAKVRGCPVPAPLIWLKLTPPLVERHGPAWWEPRKNPFALLKSRARYSTPNTLLLTVQALSAELSM